MLSDLMIPVLSFTVMEVFNKSTYAPKPDSQIDSAEVRNVSQPHAKIVELPNEFAKRMVELNPPNQRYIDSMNSKLDDIHES